LVAAESSEILNQELLKDLQGLVLPQALLTSTNDFIVAGFHASSLGAFTSPSMDIPTST
jgi:hypothetical protein